MKCDDYNPLLGYSSKVICLPLVGMVSNADYYRLKKLGFKGERRNAKSNAEKILYEKKLSDLDKGIVDALCVGMEGEIYPLGWKYNKAPGFFIRHSSAYRSHQNEFYAKLTHETDFSLGPNNASRYLQCNELGICTLSELDFYHNPPTALEMHLYGFLRKPEYMEKYSILVNKMDELWTDVAVRKLTPEDTANIRRRVAEYTRQAKILNEDKSYLLSVEERFKKHYASCGPGIAELAIAKLYQDSGTRAVELVSQKQKTVKNASNSADYRYRRGMLRA